MTITERHREAISDELGKVAHETITGLIPKANSLLFKAQQRALSQTDMDCPKPIADEVCDYIADAITVLLELHTKLSNVSDVPRTRYKNGGLHGMSGWYWLDGPEPRELYGSQDEAIDSALVEPEPPAPIPTED